MFSFDAASPAGRAVFTCEGKELGSVPLVTVSGMGKANYSDSLKEVWERYFGR